MWEAGNWKETKKLLFMSSTIGSHLKLLNYQNVDGGDQASFASTSL